MFIKHGLGKIESRLTSIEGEMTSEEDIPKDSLDEDKAVSDALKNTTCMSNIKEGFSLNCKVCHLLPQTINSKWYEIQTVQGQE